MMPVLFCLLLAGSAAGAEPHKPDLFEMSEQADQLDKLEFDAAIEKANRCTPARDFGCSETALAKAAKVAHGGKDKAALAASRNRLANERRWMIEELQRAEAMRLAELQRQEQARLAQLRLEEEARAQEERRARAEARREEAEEARLAQQEREEQQARDAEDRASTRAAWADVGNQILKRAAENAAVLRNVDRGISDAVGQANRVRAEQAAERERASAERAERLAEQRRDAAREREQRQQAASARAADNERAEQRQASEALAARERAAQAAAAQERERQRIATQQQEKQERARQADAERTRVAKEESDRAGAERQDRRAYLEAMIRGIRLVATKCPDGEGHYYATGVLPASRPKGDMCIDVHYEASCPDGRQAVTGIAKNFVGLSGCFGDTYQIEPKPACAVTQVRIAVKDVTPGCN